MEWKLQYLNSNASLFFYTSKTLQSLKTVVNITRKLLEEHEPPSALVLSPLNFCFELGKKLYE